MDPASVLNSVTGVVAVTLIFGIPILAIIATLVIVFAAINRSHRERMKMIEQGMVPALPKRCSGNYYALLITGATFLAFGLAMLVLSLVSTAGEWEPALIFGFVGAALLVCWGVIRRLNRKNPTEQAEPPARTD